MISLKILLTKILQKLQFTPVLLSDTKVECTQVGTSYESTTIANIANYNVIAIQFVVHEQSQLLLFFRGEDIDRSFTDTPTAGRFRGTIKVDWEHNQILMRCIHAGTNEDRYELVYFKNVYGIA